MGVCEGILAYVGKTASGDYDPFLFRKTVTLDDVELSDDVYIVTKETAEAYVKSKAKPPVVVPEPEKPVTPTKPGQTTTPVTPRRGKSVSRPTARARLLHLVTPSDTVAKLTWTGAVPAQKWMNFYTKVLSKFASGKGLTLTVTVEAAPEGGISGQKVEETKVALRELGLEDDVISG